MNRLTSIIFGATCFLSLQVSLANSIAHASQRTANKTLQASNPHYLNATHPLLVQKLDQLLKPFDKKVHLGILVRNAQSGAVIYEKNIDHYFIPASNLKILTALAALYYLGPEFTYQTKIFANTAQLENHVLHDAVYLKFSGDPTLTFNQVEHLISQLASLGIQHIEKGIIIDDSAFDHVSLSPGTAWDDQDFCFGAPLSALILDRNCVSITLKPNHQNDFLTKSELPQHPQFIPFLNQVTTSKEEKQLCKIDAKFKNGQYELRGCLKSDAKEQKIDMAIPQPAAYFHQVLTYLLNKYHISNPSGIHFQKINHSLSNPLLVEYSPPLKEMVKTLLKESDNMIANTLFKTMGKQYTQSTQGTWENGQTALNAILREMKLNLSNAKIEDGSGLSRYNYLTPKQLMALLHKAYSSEIFSFFYNALPISGIDGTLQERMKESIPNKIHAKTGTMSGASGLSGYLQTKKNHTLMFVILINGFVDDISHYKNLENKICELLYQFNYSF